jgi:hypothetical protein
MIRLNRREFMQASTVSFLLDSVKVSTSPGSPAKIDDTATAFVRTNAGGKAGPYATPSWNERFATTRRWACTPRAGATRSLVRIS